ncbi:MAG TPA: sulfatase [Candidatus Krumholzibacteria bacterium]|nr:sulfatase [Candidatus Krumholzibacteria bacterium]
MSPDFRRSLVLGCAAGLFVGSVDAATGFVSAGSRFQSPAFAATGVVAIVLLTTLTVVLLRWLVLAPLLRRASPEALSIATVMGTSATLVILDPGSFHQSVAGLFEIILKLCAGVAVGAGAYSLALHDAQAPNLTASRLVGRMLPLATPLALVAAWFGFVAIDDVTSASFLLIALGTVVAVALLARICMHVTPRRWGAAVLATFSLFVAAGAVGGFAISHNTSLDLIGSRGGPHPVRRVILLTVDTLRRDAVSSFGSTTVSTPNIDRIAADGCSFHNVFSSSSWTLPAFASMMTGFTTRGHGVVMSTAALPDTLTTLAESFRARGYTTHALVANAMLAPHRGFAQGFRRYYLPAQPISPVCLGEVFARRLRSEPLAEATATRDITDAAIAWTTAHRDRDFFLWVHYLDPHLPYSPPPERVDKMNVHDEMGFTLDLNSATRPSMDIFGDPERRVWARSLYDGEVRYVDVEIGRFLDALHATGIYDDALIVFAVDHGEEFWDHDGFEHGHTLYNELVGVPVIIKAPRSHGARVVNDPVAIYDIMPTVLELCDLPPVATPRARSLVPDLSGDRRGEATRPIFASGTLFRSNFESVVFDGWKYIRSATTGREELFRLADDPQERASLARERPDIVKHARALLDEHARSTEAFRAARGISNREIKLDPEEIERLRALGYL